jgi:hypothetical protein
MIHSDDLERTAMEVTLAGNGSSVATLGADEALESAGLPGSESVAPLTLRSTAARTASRGDPLRRGHGAELQFVYSTRTPATVPRHRAQLAAVASTEADAAFLSGAGG